MSTGRRFNATEDRYIIDHWDDTVRGDIAKHLGRSSSGIAKRAENLGLKARRCKRWTEAEDKAILAARQRTLESVATELGRCTSEVSGRARILGIKSWRYHKNGNAYIDRRGYRVVGFHRGHPRSKVVFEHIVVAEEMLDRHLEDSERVHHINCVKLDNSQKNLFVCRDAKHHREIHCSFEALLPELFESGIVGFDRIEGRYFVCKTVK